jgi:hypothetical protein
VFWNKKGLVKAEEYPQSRVLRPYSLRYCFHIGRKSLDKKGHPVNSQFGFLTFLNISFR